MNLPAITIKVLLADDHELFRDGFKMLIKKQQDIEIIGDAENGRELVNLAKELKPDVIVTDIKMPVLDGIEATKTLTKQFPGIGIIALSMFDDEFLIVDMLEAGAKGYLLKNAQKEEIFEAIRSVHNNETYYCNKTSTRLAQMIAKSGFNPYHKKQRVDFSERELEIMRLICQEYSNKEIGEKLFISTRTVEGHRNKIQDKIKAKNMAGIIIYAVKHGIYKL
ncbi:MAG: response regulator transcription factor [Bacteroidota bacterium]|nr:response regulator transcription factor [Bacteroidota bacterium]